MQYHIEFDIDFKRNPDGGLYIALEGIDGSGKTTQVEKLVDYFTTQGKEVVRTREPRKHDGLIGNLIQQILLGKTQIPSAAFQYLFTADRVMHYEELIYPALKAGKVVISDRCFWSAIPYGIMDRGGKVEENMLEYILVAQSILSMYHQFTIPDYTFYLELPLDTAVERIEHAEGEKEIYEDKPKLAKVTEGYQWLLKQFPEEFIVINGRKPVEEVTQEIVERIKKQES